VRFYLKNTAEEIAKLDALDAEFRAVVDGGARKTIIFADRFPFRYFTDYYNLDYYAAFPGCSSETDASALTVAFLIKKVRAEKIPAVFYVEFSNEKMADLIVSVVGVKKLLFHSVNNVSKADFDDGATYVSIMKRNLENLKEALN
jgi:zinc transport system substrate-binding protein